MNSIATNIDAIAIRENLNQANDTLARTLERMSSGLKLNCAKDDAAGAVISSRINTKIGGLKLAKSNIQFGLSLLNTANGAYSNITNILTRLRDLSLQAANSTYDDDSRNAMQDEVDELTDELERIRTTTKFNNLSLFNYQSDTETANNQTPTPTPSPTPDAGQVVDITQEPQTPAVMSMRSMPMMLANSEGDDGIALASLDEGVAVAENIAGSVDFAAGETKTVEIDGVSYTVTNRNSTNASFTYSKNSETSEITISCSYFTIKGQNNVTHSYIVNGKYNYVYGANLDDSFKLYDNFSLHNVMYGQAGNDYIELNTQQNNAYGGDGDDTIHAISYSSIYGDAGNDKIYAAGTENTIYGGDGDDYIELSGNGSNNKLYGQGGEDTFNIVSANGAVVDGGEGTNAITDKGKNTNSINVPGASSYSVDFAKNETKIITINGIQYEVTNRLSNAQTFIYSLDGNQINFSSASFTIKGQKDKAHNVNLTAKSIYFYGGDLADTIIGANQLGRIHAGGGDDNITLTTYLTTYADDGNDKITVKSSYNIIYGGDGDDSLTYSGSYNNTYIDLGKGNDSVTTSTRTVKGSVIVGAEGTNTMVTANPKFTDVYVQGFNASENAVYCTLAGGETKTIEINGVTYTVKNDNSSLDTSFTYEYNSIEDKIIFTGANCTITGQQDKAHNIELYGRNISFYGGKETDNIKAIGGWQFNLYGQGGNDNLYGGVNARKVAANGGDGDDYIEGNGTVGEYKGGKGNDIFVVNNSTNTLNGESGDDSFYINYSVSSSDNSGNNIYYLNADNINLTAGSGHDTFYVQGNNNTVNGGAGDDYFVVSGNGNVVQGGTGTNYIVNNGENPDIQDVVVDPNSGAFVFTQANEVKLIQVDDKIYTVTNKNAQGSSVVNHELSYTYNKNTGEIIITGSNVTIDCNDDKEHNIRLQGSNNILNGSKNDDIVIIETGSGNIINGKNGDDKITMETANNSINGGNGADTIILNASTNMSVNAGSGNDNLQINSDNNININLGSGADVVSGTTSGSNINLSSGNNNLLLNGSNNTVEALDGNNRISFVGDNNTIVAENGNNTIGLKGDNNSATLAGEGAFNIEGNSNDIIVDGNVTVSADGNLNNYDIGGNGLLQIKGDSNTADVLGLGTFNVTGSNNILNSSQNASYNIVGDNNQLNGEASANFNVKGSNNTLTSSNDSDYKVQGDLNT